MSKIIKMTQQHIDEMRREFEAVLRDTKVADGKVVYTKIFGSINRRATLYFTEDAWLKMQALISDFDKEVAWHGVAKRGSDATKDEYCISDILVYPQEVTGSTVNTDQAKYQMWLMMHEDDVFNNIRMQGHSHVNMPTSPSSVDISHQEKILEQLEDDMFYIFLIWNKRGDKTVKIYDLEKNVLFETADVDVKVVDDDNGIQKFIREAKEMVKDKVYTPTTLGAYSSVYTGGSKYTAAGGYNHHDSYYHTGVTMPYSTPTPATAGVSQPVEKGNGNGKKKKGKRKGRKKGSASPALTVSQTQLTMYEEDDNATGMDTRAWQCY